MRRIRILLALAAVGASLLGVTAPGASAGRAVPRGFVGANADGPLVADLNMFGNQLKPMVRAGVESIRFNFDWRRIQPYRSSDDVPPAFLPYYPDVNGVPTDFRATDEKVGDAATRGITVEPVLMYAPGWAARHPGSSSSPPKDFNAYAHFVATMVERYGSNGSFWLDNPTVPFRPIRNWQIWNEPHFKEFWKDRPWAGDYVKMLKRADTAIHGADSAARTVLAGLANRSWRYLDAIYRKGAKGHFDLVALHPFTMKVHGVIEIVDRARRVMKEHHDGGRSVVITEMSWTSARGKTSRHFGIEQTEEGQAKQLANAYELVARARKRLKLRAVYWYTWISRDRSEVDPFDYAGVMKVRNGDPVKKPAYRALRKLALPLEGCASKSTGDATACD
ncbi:MAG: polysaccharide biosynthesis protein PslG [Thermoleophilaceae bacterium]|nr:polysaccharide biosynthesis protein PslG [Thermoleophilaceae bacterium]